MLRAVFRAIRSKVMKRQETQDKVELQKLY